MSTLILQTIMAKDSFSGLPTMGPRSRKNTARASGYKLRYVRSHCRNSAFAGTEARTSCHFIIPIRTQIFNSLFMPL